MPTVTIPDATFERLARHAAALGTTVDAVATTAIDRAVPEDGLPAPPPAVLHGEAWRKAFDELTALIRSRAHMYPPGFEVDDSREAIYDERLRSQM